VVLVVVVLVVVLVVVVAVASRGRVALLGGRRVPSSLLAAAVCLFPHQGPGLNLLGTGVGCACWGGVTRGAGCK